MACIADTMPPGRVRPEGFDALIETPAGSKVKYELDAETGLVAADRILSVSARYPWNYGLIPLTAAPDGDPLDVLVISSEPLAPGTLARCRPVGILRMEDSGERDDKVLAVMPSDPAYGWASDVAQLPAHLAEEARHFFSVYKALEGKRTEAGAVEGPGAAREAVRACMDAYREKQ